MRVLITGSSGLIGKALSLFLTKNGHQVEKLRLANLDAADLEGIDALVHLAGESLSKGLWTSFKKKKIYESRVFGTKTLVQALEKLKNPPKVFIAASAVGYYAEQEGQIEENSPSGSSFLSIVCQDWEKASQNWDHPHTRVVVCRFGYVLSKDGGLLQALKGIFLAGLGAVMGGGRQFMPWVDMHDLVRALEYVMLKEAIKGPVNVVAPYPVRQEDFARVLARLLRRPCIFSVPKWLILGEKMKSLLLPSLQVYPVKLQKSGFHFLYTDLEESLSHQLLE